MGDALAEGLGLTPFRIHVMGEEIAGVTGVNDEIRFADRSAMGFADGTDRVVLEILFVDMHLRRFPIVLESFLDFH
jgi:hypothetical protein